MNYYDIIANLPDDPANLALLAAECLERIDSLMENAVKDLLSDEADVVGAFDPDWADEAEDHAGRIQAERIARAYLAFDPEDEAELPRWWKTADA